MFVRFLLDRKYLYRDKKGRLLPYAQYVDDLFTVKECINEKTQWAGTQTMVTPKGRETFPAADTCSIIKNAEVKASDPEGPAFFIPKRGDQWKDKVPVLRANAYEGCSGGGRDQAPPLQKDMFDSVSAR